MHEEPDKENSEEKKNEKVNKVVNENDEFNRIEEENDESIDSEVEIINRINKNRKTVSSKTSPSTCNFLDIRKKNKLFDRLMISPVMQPIKNENLMQSNYFLIFLI